MSKLILRYFWHVGPKLQIWINSDGEKGKWKFQAFIFKSFWDIHGQTSDFSVWSKGLQLGQGTTFKYLIYKAKISEQ